jgi:hypothetical protein
MSVLQLASAMDKDLGISFFLLFFSLCFEFEFVLITRI